MPYCGTASKWSKIGLVTQFIGLALFLSGFATIGWMATLTVQNNKDIIVGLFRMIDCSTGSCSTQDISTAYENSTHFEELIYWYFVTSKVKNLFIEKNPVYKNSTHFFVIGLDIFDF